MEDAYTPVVALQTGMVLGSDSWLNAIARNADLAYGYAHGPQGLFSQSWFIPPGLGIYTIWEGVTVYDGCHVNLNFSAWVAVADGKYAMLQLYYDNAWHDFVADTSAGEHWFDDANDVGGVVSYNISSYYSAGDIVRARLLTEDSGAGNTVYRATLGGAAFKWPDNSALTWPSWPAWTNNTAHSAGDFNTLRTAVEYLRRCAQRPTLGTEKGYAEHLQGGAGDYQTLFRWSFRLGGQQELHMTLTTQGCLDPDDWIGVFIEDEQYPHGPNGSTRLATLATYTTDGNKTLDADLSAYSVGTYYTIEVGRKRTAAGPSATVTSCWLRDLAGVARANTPGVFAYGTKPTAATLTALSADLEDMKPVNASDSPLWYEHPFATIRGMNQEHYQVAPAIQLYHYAVHQWGIAHLYDYIYWAGAGQIVSADGLHRESLSDSAPAGQVQAIDTRRFNWLAKGDRYTAQDTSSGQLLTIFEHWEA